MQVTLAALGLGAMGMVQFFRLQRRRRLMEDMPTAHVRSAAQGYVELIGTAHAPDLPLFSPLTRTPCAWYRYKVERRKGEGNSSWETESRGVSDIQFWLDDGTGHCIIDPERAEVRCLTTRTWTGAIAQVVPGSAGEVIWFGDGDHRYTEELVLPGQELYALGWFSSLSPLQVSAHDEVRERVAAWKTDPEQRRAFDTDGNGQLDMAEFERLRAAAFESVAKDRAERATHPQTHVMRRPPDGRLFLLSTQPHMDLKRKLRLQAWVWLAAGLAGLGLGAAQLLG